MTNDQEVTDLTDWVQKTLFQKLDDSTYYYPYDQITHSSLLGSETVLYSVKLHDNFLVSIIDGVAVPAQFKYQKLLETLFAVTAREASHWFYITDPDNCLSLLNYKQPLRMEAGYSKTHTLELFEEEKAQQGGVSYLLLVGVKKTWVLHHEFNPANDFTVSFHGPKALAESLVSELGISMVEDLR